MYLQKVYFYLLGDTSLHLIFINFLPLFYILFCKTMRPLVKLEIPRGGGTVKYLPFTWGIWKFLLENQMFCAFWEASENMGFDLRTCSFSTLFSLLS